MTFDPEKNSMDLFVFLSFLLLVATLAVGISGCTTSPKTEGTYKFDLKGKANGMSFEGIGVLPKSSSYDLMISSSVNVDLFTIATCHREFTVTNAITVGWLQPRKSYEITFTPIPGIEDQGSCLIRLGAYNRSEGQNAWGILDIEDQTANLPARNDCNGDQWATHGASICQARAGLLQRLYFPVAVRLSKSAVKEECKIPDATDGQTWEYEMPKGECVYAFQELTSPYRIHRHTTLGYTDIKIRGDQ